MNPLTEPIASKRLYFACSLSRIDGISLSWTKLDGHNLFALRKTTFWSFCWLDGNIFLSHFTFLCVFGQYKINKITERWTIKPCHIQLKSKCHLEIAVCESDCASACICVRLLQFNLDRRSFCSVCLYLNSDSISIFLT